MGNQLSKHEVRNIYFGIAHKYILLIVGVLGAILAYYLVDSRMLKTAEHDLENQQSKLIVEILKVDNLDMQKAILVFLKHVYPPKQQSRMALYIAGLEQAIENREKNLAAVKKTLQNTKIALKEESDKQSPDEQSLKGLETVKQELEAIKKEKERPVRVVETTIQDVKRSAVVIDVAHTPDKPGAVSSEGLSEYAYNDKLARLVQNYLDNCGISSEVIKLGSYSERAFRINLIQPKLILSLHANAGPAAASGSEVVIPSGSDERVKDVAKEILSAIVSTLNLRNRGINTNPWIFGRVPVFKLYNSPVVLLLPFFLSNDNDVKVAVERRNELAQALAKTIEQWVNANPNV